MNKYNSRLQRFWARDVAGANVVPAIGTDLTVSNWRSLVQVDMGYGVIQEINAQGNIILRDAGLYCNFADGLVLADPTSFFNLDLAYKAWVYDSALTGTMGIAPGTRAVTGVGTLFTAELAVNDAIQFGGPNAPIFLIESITDDLNLVVRQLAPAGATGTANKLTVVGGDDSLRYEIRTLNELIPLDDFTSPLIIGADIEYITLEAKISSGAPIHPSWHTDAILASFVGDSVVFDISLDIEYTPA